MRSRPGDAMILESLQVLNVRRLHDASLAATDRINVIWGPNGSGKTSLLEAIHLLGTGRSFRSHKASEVISHGRSSLIVSGTVADASGGSAHVLGLEKTSSTTRIRADGEALKSASQLAEFLPTLVLTADSFALLDGGPSVRRALLDRTLFHVEHAYLDHLKRAYRALQQRNELLRTGDLGKLQPWDTQFVAYAERMDVFRRAAVESLNSILESLSDRNDLPIVSLEYRRGWKSGVDFLELLESHRERDRLAGFTTQGPHRAELRILCLGRPAGQVVSRGQGKLLLAVLIGALATLISRRSGRSPVLLIDDLPAELDKVSAGKALATLLDTGCQSFLTTIDPESLLDRITKPFRVFHVEQGKISPSHVGLGQSQGVATDVL